MTPLFDTALYLDTPIARRGAAFFYTDKEGYHTQSSLSKPALHPHGMTRSASRTVSHAGMFLTGLPGIIEG